MQLSLFWLNKVIPDGSACVLLLYVPHPKTPPVEVSVRGTHVLRPGLSSPRLAEPQADLPLCWLEAHHPTRACGASTGSGLVGERIPSRLQMALIAAKGAACGACGVQPGRGTVGVQPGRGPVGVQPGPVAVPVAAPVAALRQGAAMPRGAAAPGPYMPAPARVGSQLFRLTP